MDKSCIQCGQPNATVLVNCSAHRGEKYCCRTCWENTPSKTICVEEGCQTVIAVINKKRRFRKWSLPTIDWKRCFQEMCEGTKIIVFILIASLIFFITPVLESIYIIQSFDPSENVFSSTFELTALLIVMFNGSILKVATSLWFISIYVISKLDNFSSERFRNENHDFFEIHHGKRAGVIIFCVETAMIGLNFLQGSHNKTILYIDFATIILCDIILAHSYNISLCSLFASLSECIGGIFWEEKSETTYLRPVDPSTHTLI